MLAVIWKTRWAWAPREPGDRVAKAIRHAQKSDPTFHKAASQLLLSNDSLPGLIPPFDRLHQIFDDAAKLGVNNIHIHGLLHVAW